MKLQAVTVSVNYSDFLCHIIPENKTIFDKWIIVTDTKDYQTKALCDEHGLTCVQTDVFYEKARFNKFAGINEGLKLVDSDAWIVFLDSDIILQPETRHILRNLDLQKDHIYGIDRVNCTGMERWLQFKASNGLVKDNWLLHSAGLELGARLVHYYGFENGDGKFAGWQPVGYFQLCHRSSFDQYPQNSLGADHCDLMFPRDNFHRNKRVFIPEMLAIHIESDDAKKADNWWGRKTKPFVLNKQSECELPDPSPTLNYCKPKFSWRRFWRDIKMFFKSIWWYIIWFFTDKCQPY